MKNKLFLMIMVVMVCSLTACGQQETETMTNTGNSTEQVVTSEDNSELATAEDNNMEQTETKKQNQLQDVKPSYKEFRGVLDEIDSDIQMRLKKRQYHGFLIKETLNRWNFRISLHLCMMHIRNY